MPTEPEPSDAERFAPHAAREMASMFDDVSRRYDLLNRLMTLGQDDAWRAAMWRAVPETARVCLDLCTGNGASLAGLRRPGRRVIGVDVSLRMLVHAARGIEGRPWAPCLACADAFRLPLADGTLDAITVAFGVRNLRPRARALAEIRRVLRPGGTLAVLEAAAPSGGAFAPLHTFYLRRLIPLAGRLSDDPSAYEYLSRSIFEFGSGPEFERDLEAVGFEILERRSFMMRATRLWVARTPAAGAGTPPAGTGTLQNATSAPPSRSELPQPRDPLESEWRGWLLVQIVTSAALSVALVLGIVTLVRSGTDVPLEPWQRRGLWVLLVGGLAGFVWRTLVLSARWRAGPPRRGQDWG